MTCSRIVDVPNQNCAPVVVQVAVEPTPPERDMISEGNPNICEKIVDAKAIARVKITPEFLQRRRRLWLELTRRIAAMTDQHKTHTVPVSTNVAHQHQDKRSGVQWGRCRGLPDATWEEGLGLAFLRRSAEVASMAPSLHTHGVHGATARSESRTGGSTAELLRSSRDAEGRTP